MSEEGLSFSYVYVKLINVLKTKKCNILYKMLHFLNYLHVVCLIGKEDSYEHNTTYQR